MDFPPPPFTLRQLQYAVAVAEALSFKKAAERCRVSQPSLSAQLAQLEAALGVRLFERDRRRVFVTAAGREVIERARLVLREAGDLLELARRAADPFAGTLCLGVIPTISPYLLPRLTPVLHAAYPRLRLRWREDKTEVLVRDLHAGSLDGALLALEAELGEVEREVIARDPFVLVAPQGHALAASHANVTVAELRGATVFVLQDEHCFGKQAAAFCSDTSARVDALRATSLTTLVQVVAAGEGVTLLPALAVPYEATNPQLCLRAFAEPAPARTIALVWRKGYPFEAALRHLAATIRQAYPAPSAAVPCHKESEG
ncbi:MAG: LysR family transcriptional regulator [Candidatus Tectimicrobiota bacterium]|nr:MAG: LysR family transcriptional regulator [Candidatus Tectomicrobia bacterium]